MKDIHRIHLAKVPYEIESAARTLLSRYLDDLKAVNPDPDVLLEVEGRMVELLTERGISAGKVITEADVEALIAQLGEAQAFSDDNEAAAPSKAVTDGKKFYRDLDHAIGGGVLTGLSTRLGIDVILLRLAAVVIILASGGTALIIYVLLWIMVPAATTSADRLRMLGRPVTAASLSALDDADFATRMRDRSRRRRRVMAVASALVLLLAAAAALVVTVVGGIRFGTMELPRLNTPIDQYFYVILGLAVLSGLALMTLCLIGAIAALRQKFGRSTLIACCLTILVGLASFGGTIGLALYAARAVQTSIDTNTMSVALQLPVGVESITRIEGVTGSVNVRYVVSDQPRAVVTYLEHGPSSQPDVEFSLNGDTLTVISNDTRPPDLCRYACKPSTLEIYGPELAGINLRGGTLEYEARDQGTLSIQVGENSYVSLMNGSIGSLSANIGRGGSIATERSAVSAVELSLADQTNASLGNIATLTAIAPTSCPRDASASLNVASITPGGLTINGQNVARNQSGTCLSLTVDSFADETE